MSLQLDETRSGFVKDVHVLVLSASQRKKNTPQKKQNKQNQNKIFKKCSLKRGFFFLELYLAVWHLYVHL